MKVSAIEIGTNSTKFLIARFNDRRMEIIEKDTVINRLSRNMYEGDCISDEAVENGVKIIGEFIAKSAEQSAKLIAVFSTSVLRDARNRNLFIQRVQDLYGIPIEVISGEREAFFAFKACGSLIQDSQENFVTVDIGGGSTEFTAGNKNEIAWKTSVDIGAVRLTEMFIRHDPVIEAEIQAITNYIDGKLGDRLSRLNGRRLVGAGGTVKTAGTMILRENYQNENAVHGLTIGRDQLESLYHALVKLTTAERESIPGLNPKRADVIIAGILILLTIMRKTGFDRIMVSSYGVLEGFLENYRHQEFHN